MTALRTKRILRDAFFIWQRENGVLSDSSTNSLRHFCRVNNFEYKRISRWMSHGISQRHSKTQPELERLCEVLKVDSKDFWNEDKIEVSVDAIEELIHHLGQLQTGLMKLLPTKEGDQRELSDAELDAQIRARAAERGRGPEHLATEWQISWYRDKVKHLMQFGRKLKAALDEVLDL
jgi:hypothetical protein